MLPILRVWLALSDHHDTNSFISIAPLLSESKVMRASAISFSVNSAPNVTIKSLNSSLSIDLLLSLSNFLNVFFANTSICFAGLGDWPTRLNHQASHSSTFKLPSPSASIFIIASSSSCSRGRPKCPHSLFNSPKFSSPSPLSASANSARAILACCFNSTSVARFALSANCSFTSGSKSKGGKLISNLNSTIQTVDDWFASVDDAIGACWTIRHNWIL